MHARSLLSSVALVVLFMALSAATGAGVPATDRFERGMEAYRNGQYERAQTLLAEVVSKTPAYVHDSLGAAAFWLGKTHEATGNLEARAESWSEGVAALREAGQFDARLFDAYLGLQEGEEPERAERVADLYLALLRQTDVDRGGRVREIWRRHVTQAFPLLTAAEKRRLRVRSDTLDAGDIVLQADAGRWLASWWSSQDPVLATPTNERIQEHLRRVAYARSHFTPDDSTQQWDDRGDLYVRLGAPERTHTIPFDDLKFIRELQQLGVNVGRTDFPDNVIWRYPSLGEEGAYLFVREDGQFRLAEAPDLLPRELTSHFSSSGRNLKRAAASLSAMRYVYKHLSMHYHDRGNVYSKVSSYLDSKEGIEQIRSVGGNNQVPQSSIDPPTTAANDVLRESERQERTFVRKREQEMPRAHTEMGESTEELPLSVRFARFLSETGEPRTEIYWGGPVAASSEPDEVPDYYLLNLSAIRYDSDFQRREETTEQYSVAAGEKRVLSPQRTTIDGASDPYHIALQWTRHEGEGNPGALQPGEKQGGRVVRIDSLRPLEADPSRLEMSDIQLRAVPGSVRVRDGFSVEQARPYPFDRVESTTPLVLYFELYGLQRGSEERTQYTVSYELTIHGDGGILWGLFGDGDEQLTSATTTYRGEAARTEEYVVLDVDQGLSEPRPASVTVRVQDETSNRTVERSLNLTLVPPEAES